jgi:hypothetical protein
LDCRQPYNGGCGGVAYKIIMVWHDTESPQEERRGNPHYDRG